MLLTVVKEFRFEAAHFLPRHPGLCKNLHGHSYRLQIGFKGQIDNDGMVIDFGNLKSIVTEHIIERLDHQCLNDAKLIPYLFPTNTPTAENMVRWIHLALNEVFKPFAELNLIRLWETETSYCEWRK